MGEERTERVLRRGDADRITSEYFDGLLLEMRHIDAVEPSTVFGLYGETFRTPVMFAALSHLDKTYPNGGVEAAKGVKAAGAVMWYGMSNPAEMEAILATGARTIAIIKPYADNGAIMREMEHAEQHGALAVGMDIDHQGGSAGSRGNVLGIPMGFKSLDDVKALVRATKLPFVLKGVLSEVDARKCVDAGVRGIVVSHHHGMVDYPVPPLAVLPRIVKVVNGLFPVFVDCSVRRGIDVFKALALGASAVGLGRVVMEPLKTGGAEGVQKCIEACTADLSWTMAVTAAKDIAHIDPAVIVNTNGF
ncbi:MAG: alpha-hydroxy-acid oxidizing protein [Spirochaetaceae bacterium]|jgi:isopentenyl diphosphate isomerase/L-lactate dehydrogenase-like FMN-dependent dehydrogenase|nr:alpha-hydroxy-acid oxidizing protein [Spirochaetaceae bacterium]